MAVSKAKTGVDIINGSAVALAGHKRNPSITYDNTQRTQHLADTTGAVFAVVANRYLHHGGTSGSGNWEH